MSWLRFSDDFADWPEWDMASVEARWAYVCLVQACSRGKYWDGCLPKKRALAALVAQVDDPQQALERLAILSLIHEDRGQQLVKLPRIHDHVPPPSVRKNTEASRVRMRRKRAHDSGDHSTCLDSCSASVTDLVTGDVTRNTRTGQDGSSRGRHDSRNADAS